MHDESITPFVDEMIYQAIKQSASDIHIEPYATQCRIRFRRDGILFLASDIPGDIMERFITRLKVMAKLDIAEKRLPQDGRFLFSGIDIRVNTCPTLYGEKIVLRLLNAKTFSLSIDALGLMEHQKKLFLEKVSQPHGLILVTGPTGSGKTVTLYSAIQYRNALDVNISTVEDPIEIQLAGINQINVNPKIGLGFANILRGLLRQDPDILMIGEIRDTETAEIAIQAAHTGHLVFSTLHTHRAKDVKTRLTAMGISNYHLTHSLSLIITQRLLRKLCDNCKEPDSTPHPQDQSITIYRAKSCKNCLNGYQGRIGIYEFLTMQGTQTSHEDTLERSAFNKLAAGVTSLSEIHRILCI